ncbi:recombinase family protein [Psychromonas antarctica]|uniref:recombinase family protein n=1 Tax=Psychromonas antarctica TaxID=67573 RepID=UPI001EE858B1|nr:recombinase family protein [Psychromonas antarctica]MCG6202767.1 recombinase family protein [Psychromonas antarctica]
MKLAYIRVSTIEQNTDRQVIKADKTFTDKVSGANTDRPELIKLKEHARAGDVVICHDISRLARNLKDLKDLVEFFIDRGVAVKFIKENMRFTADKQNPMNELMLNMLGAVYQFERDIMKQRQAEGIAQAKVKGVYKGRSTSMRLKAAIIEEYKQGTPQRKIANNLDTSLSTVQRIVKSYKELSLV